MRVRAQECVFTSVEEVNRKQRDEPERLSDRKDVDMRQKRRQSTTSVMRTSMRRRHVVRRDMENGRRQVRTRDLRG